MGISKTGIKNYDLLKKQIEQMQAAPKAVLKATVSDMKKRVPGWIAAEVSKRYYIKKADAMPGKKGLGTINVIGADYKTVSVRYRGEKLSPAKFRISPSALRKGQSTYTLKTEIVRGQTHILGKRKRLTKKQRGRLLNNLAKQGKRTSKSSPILLGKFGGKYMPFKRISEDRDDIELTKSVSLPDMVRGQRVHDAITQVINDGLQDRLEHHMKRFMPGK